MPVSRKLQAYPLEILRNGARDCIEVGEIGELDVGQIMAPTMDIRLDGRAHDPVQESTEKDEVADPTEYLPALGPFREAAAFDTLPLLRSIGGEFRVKLLVGSQKSFALRING